MATSVFGILLTIVVILFLMQLLGVVLYQYSSSHAPVLEVACAGSEKPCTPKELKVTNIHWDGFRKADGNILSVEDYDRYIVMGESMLLGGIQNQDFVFVKKVPEPNHLILPAIMVLRREPAALQRAAMFDDKAELKIRRSWRMCSLSCSDKEINAMVNAIIMSDDFQALRRMDESKFLSNEWMLNDFSNRLMRYRNEHSGCEQANHPDNMALISTTYDTMQGRVHFSIHSSHSIVGKVEYAFGINQNLEVA